MNRAIVIAVVALVTGIPEALAQGGVISDSNRKSGFDMMGPEAQGMQRDDTQNPAMLWVRHGEDLWRTPAGQANLSCMSCHQDATTTMKGVAARYPAFDAATARPIDLSGKIQQCRTERQKAPDLARESRGLLGLAAYIGQQSRGMPVAPPDDPRLTPFQQEGEALFTHRMGQLNLSCVGCHTDNWGQRLGGSTIPQGHANGYPIYRLEWQGVGSLQRRLRNCLTGVRAEPFAYGDPALIKLELYLNARGAGLPVETPGVRP
jgi:L-cysteine S-thiosulfotransferase